MATTEATNEHYRLIYLCTSNVCRSPLADAVARYHVSKCGLSERVEVSSRGLTDAYSSWGSPTEPRMIAAAQRAGAASPILDFLNNHKSKLLTRSEVLDNKTILFLVTTMHQTWASETVGDDAMDRAFQERRVHLIDSSGSDIDDPYFGDEINYDEVCQTILQETPKTLTAVMGNVFGITIEPKF